MTKKTTSVKLDPEILQQVKQICKERDCLQSKFIENAIIKQVKQDEEPHATTHVEPITEDPPKIIVEDVEESKPHVEFVFEPKPMVEFL